MEYLKVNTADSVCTITINRPEVYNALNYDAKYEIINAIRSANKDDSVRAIIVTGEGKAFSSGQDLNDRKVSGEDGPVDLGHTLETEWIPLVDSIRNSKKLIIGAINGVCAGAGLSVAVACDFIIAKPGVRFVSGFSQLGLIPDAGSSFIFTKAMGYQKTLEFFLFNEPLYSEDMERYGLINLIDEDYLGKANEWAKKIAGMAPLSIEFIKKNLQMGQQQTMDEILKLEVAAQRFCGNSADYQEGLKAFMEKRKPEFKGQ